MNKPMLRSGALVSPVSDGYVVYDIERNRFHELNATAALLLELCDGRRSVDEITEIASQVLPDDVDDVVESWISEAEEAGLLIEGDGADQVAAQEMSAEDLVQLAAKLRDEGLVQAAYLCQEHAVALDSDDASQLHELGELAHIVGRRAEAREAYQRYLELTPDDAEVRHLLTSLSDEQAPARMPDACVLQLFERFASFYDTNMCGDLGYEGPMHLGAVIDDTLQDRRDLNVLDLGCGTGLAGLIIQDRAKRLVGVDLSPEMVEQSRTRGIYDELHTAEVTQWLTDSSETFDLIMACDTFIYFGDLTSVLALAAERLAAGGTIAFSVERAESGSHQLTDNGRYVHHRSHLASAAQAAGLTICSDRQAFIRMEYGVPVDGLYVCLSRVPDDAPEARMLDGADIPGKAPTGISQNSATTCSPYRAQALNPVLT